VPSLIVGERLLFSFNLLPLASMPNARTFQMLQHCRAHVRRHFTAPCLCAEPAASWPLDPRGRARVGGAGGTSVSALFFCCLLCPRVGAAVCPSASLSPAPRSYVQGASPLAPTQPQASQSLTPFLAHRPPFVCLQGNARAAGAPPTQHSLSLGSGGQRPRRRCSTAAAAAPRGAWRFRGRSHF
jgi:hypothetical protein